MVVRRTVLLIALINAAYFVIEFYFGHRFNSVSLIGDSVDFLEDTSLNLLVALAIGWSLRKRVLTGYVLSALLLVPGITFLWVGIDQVLSPEVPNGAGMGVVAFGALVVNIYCAYLIWDHKHLEGGLIKAAYYSARNDAIVNALTIIAGIVTLFSGSVIPDLVIGIIIFTLNASAAKKVISAARNEV